MNEDYRKNTDWHKYNQNKKERVLEMLTPLCKGANIGSFDYIIEEQSEDGYGTSEYLLMEDQKIGCCGDSDSAIYEEALAYVFLTRYHRHLGPFSKQTKNYLRQYWINKEEK